jgi:hypothetical protein
VPQGRVVRGGGWGQDGGAPPRRRARGPALPACEQHHAPPCSRETCVDPASSTARTVARLCRGPKCAGTVTTTPPSASCACPPSTLRARPSRWRTIRLDLCAGGCGRVWAAVAYHLYMPYSDSAPAAAAACISSSIFCSACPACTSCPACTPQNIYHEAVKNHIKRTHTNSGGTATCGSAGPPPLLEGPR